MTKTRRAIQQCAVEVASLIAKEGYYTTLAKKVYSSLGYLYPTDRFDSEDIAAVAEAVRPLLYGR